MEGHGTITTPVEDIEANFFALCLLMPEHLVRAEVRKMGGVDLGGNEDIRKLAKTFGVPETAMAVRLGQLMGARIR